MRSVSSAPPVRSAGSSAAGRRSCKGSAPLVATRISTYLHQAQDFSVVDGLLRHRTLEEIEGKRFAHKRAFLLDGVLVELFLIEPWPLHELLGEIAPRLAGGCPVVDLRTAGRKRGRSNRIPSQAQCASTGWVAQTRVRTTPAAAVRGAVLLASRELGSERPPGGWRVGAKSSGERTLRRRYSFAPQGIALGVGCRATPLRRLQLSAGSTGSDSDVPCNRSLRLCPLPARCYVEVARENATNGLGAHTPSSSGLRCATSLASTLVSHWTGGRFISAG